MAKSKRLFISASLVSLFAAISLSALAEELDDSARAELWPRLVAQYPQLDDAQSKTTRQIPVFMLTRQD